MAKHEPPSQEKSEKTAASVITPFGGGKFDNAGGSVSVLFGLYKRAGGGGEGGKWYG